MFWDLSEMLQTKVTTLQIVILIHSYISELKSLSGNAVLYIMISYPGKNLVIFKAYKKLKKYSLDPIYSLQHTV